MPSLAALSVVGGGMQSQQQVSRQLVLQTRQAAAPRCSGEGARPEGVFVFETQLNFAQFLTDFFLLFFSFFLHLSNKIFLLYFSNFQL